MNNCCLLIAQICHLIYFDIVHRILRLIESYLDEMIEWRHSRWYWIGQYKPSMSIIWGRKTNFLWGLRYYIFIYRPSPTRLKWRPHFYSKPLSISKYQQAKTLMPDRKIHVKFERNWDVNKCRMWQNEQQIITIKCHANRIPTTILSKENHKEKNRTEESSWFFGCSSSQMCSISPTHSLSFFFAASQRQWISQPSKFK